MNTAVICDAYRGFANISLMDADEVLAVGVSGSDDGEGKNVIVRGDTARCFPLSDAKVCIISGWWVFVPWHHPASR